MAINDDARKVILAGIGALNAAAEKTQETIDTLAQKGEEALNHGQVLNERLRHKIKQTLQNENTDKSPDQDAILNALDGLSPEARKAVMAKLKKLDQNGK